MAGYVVRDWHAQEFVFNIGDPDIVKKIHEANDGRRVMILQLDGDELAAALWGLQYFDKPHPGTDRDITNLEDDNEKEV